MDMNRITALLTQFQRGEISLEEAVGSLEKWPFEDLEYAKIDHHRKERQGFAEVVFAQGKTPVQVAGIIERLVAANTNVLATRANEEHFLAVKKVVPDAKYYDTANLIIVKREETVLDEKRYILVMTAGTSDIPVAEEAALTAEIMGNCVKRVFDVGVAGIHRLLAQRKVIEEANVLIVVAGMEGALASVVGGMVDKPVIAVPTSVGYGASFGGVAALLSMLNSCAAGVAVVNIDNGFGAGRMASIINKMR
ncbi:MAG: larB [Firmicutes bacterium]|nr:larB [Bacillota bacterium]